MSLMNTQYDSIMRMYAARQARSRQEYEERIMESYWVFIRDIRRPPVIG